jgi:hypothetical protein
MRFRWLVALAVILGLIWVTGATASPKGPAGGDPDIWERSRPNGSNAVALVNSPTLKPVAINLLVLKASVGQQVVTDSSAMKGKGRPTISRPVTGRR